MPKSPSAPPAINPGDVTSRSQASNLLTGQEGQAGSTIGQSSPTESLTYGTTIDPITGQVKYQANQQLTPDQQAIFNELQGQQIGAGATGLGNIFSNFGQYTGNVNQELLSGTNSLTNQFVNAQDPAWERFMAPARAQLDTSLRNQGILPGTPAYQQQVDAQTQQQLLTKGSALAAFQPQAYQEAASTFGMPLSIEGTLMGMSHPEAGLGYVNTPGMNVNPTDVAGIYETAQQQAFKNYQQKVASQNALMNGLLGGFGGAMKLPTGDGSSFGGDLLTSGMGTLAGLFGGSMGTAG